MYDVYRMFIVNDTRERGEKIREGGERGGEREREERREQAERLKGNINTQFHTFTRTCDKNRLLCSMIHHSKM